MIRALRAPRRWLADHLSSAAAYLGSVFVAVLSVPVLPDIAVEVFGDADSRWRNPVLRVAAVLVVVVACVAIEVVRRRIARRRRLRTGYRLGNLSLADLLVLPLSPGRSSFRPPDRQTGEQSVAEKLIDETRPAMVLGITSPEVSSAEVAALRAGLDAEGVGFVQVHISDAFDPMVAVPECERAVIAAVGRLEEAPESICVDVTSGTKTMTLAMMRVAALLHAECAYVSARFDGANRLPNTQRAHGFSPQLTGGAGS